jgi:hypothetical protein
VGKHGHQNDSKAEGWKRIIGIALTAATLNSESLNTRQMCAPTSLRETATTESEEERPRQRRNKKTTKTRKVATRPEEGSRGQAAANENDEEKENVS